MVFPHRPIGFADGLLPFRYAVWTWFKSFHRPRWGSASDKVAAGMNPAANGPADRNGSGSYSAVTEIESSKIG